MELILGLDLSLTGSAVAIIDRGTGNLFEKPCTLKNKLVGVARLGYIRTEIISLIYNLQEKHTICPVFIEGYGFSFRGKDFSLAELGGIVRLSLLESINQPYYEVPPTSLKLFVTGKGNAPKNIMLEQVYRKYKVGSDVLQDDNQVDAFALAKFGAAYLNWVENKKDNKVPEKLQSSFKKICGCDCVDWGKVYL